MVACLRACLFVCFLDVTQHLFFSPRQCKLFDINTNIYNCTSIFELWLGNMVIVLLFASKAIQDFLGARAGERTVGRIDGLQWKARHDKIETRIFHRRPAVESKARRRGPPKERLTYLARPTPHVRSTAHVRPTSHVRSTAHVRPTSHVRSTSHHARS